MILEGEGRFIFQPGDKIMILSAPKEFDNRVIKFPRYAKVISVFVADEDTGEQFAHIKIKNNTTCLYQYSVTLSLEELSKIFDYESL